MPVPVVAISGSVRDAHCVSCRWRCSGAFGSVPSHENLLDADVWAIVELRVLVNECLVPGLRDHGVRSPVLGSTPAAISKDENQKPGASVHARRLRDRPPIKGGREVTPDRAAPRPRSRYETTILIHTPAADHHRAYITAAGAPPPPGSIKTRLVAPAASPFVAGMKSSSADATFRVRLLSIPQQGQGRGDEQGPRMVVGAVVPLRTDQAARRRL